jgi:hypothetical protein
MHTSAGMARLHIAKPAVPPARIIAPMLSSDGEDPDGVTAFLVISYTAK